MKTVLKTLALALSLGVLAVVPVWAQDAPATDSATAPAKAAEDTKTLATVLAEISKSVGITVVAESSIAQTMIVPPTEAVTPETLDAQLALIVKKLPRGTTWAKLFLPTPVRPYRADDLLDYALAQAKLFGAVGSTTGTDTIEVLGQKVVGEKATSVTTNLNLKPVYLLANPSLRVAKDSGSNDWSKMTPEQRKQYADQQAQALLAMAPQDRAAAMQQMMEQQRAVMGSLMGSMTPAQRQQFFQGMGFGGGNANGGGRRGGNGGGGYRGGNGGGGN